MTEALTPVIYMELTGEVSFLINVNNKLASDLLAFTWQVLYFPGLSGFFKNEAVHIY